MTRYLPLVAVATRLAVGSAAGAQPIPRDEYLRNVPLDYPTLVRQTEANVEVALFGDAADPGYRDVDPVDGIDDARGRVLLDLAVRFAPYLVLNTAAVPMDVRRFMSREESFPLFIDTWDVSRDRPELVRTEEVAWEALGRPSCDDRAGSTLADTPDCLLRALLDRFDPIAPGPAYRTGAVGPEREEVQVLFFDLPGHDEQSWQREFVGAFSDRLPSRYESYVKSFVHPFVVRRDTGAGETPRYDLVLQYWFYYPFNDGAMNHEGDWEHINVSIAPMDAVAEPLSRASLERILGGGGLSDSAPDRLVIRSIDYYFHHFVMTLDYSRPNVYAPRDEWEREIEDLVVERRGERWLWRQTRRYAYRDEAETVVSTHPIGYIGADNKGNDQLLKAPGGSNRDSHGTYPFPAIYKDVGPAGAAERIEQRFDHARYFAEGGDVPDVPPGGFGRGSVVGFASPDRLEILPDGERVVELVKRDARARRQWAWLVLPVRWGYPATPSPFSWLVTHADLGNASPVGPSYNSAWNRPGNAAGYETYAPHRFGSLFPLSWQDGFRNDLGYLNLTGPTLVVLPPFDFLWRVVAAPFRRLFGVQDPIFQTGEHIPYRVMSLSIVAGRAGLGDEFGDLILNRPLLDDLAVRAVEALERAGGITGEESGFVNDVTVTGAQVSLYLGQRFASENALWHGRSYMGFDVALPTIDEVFSARADLEFWEYTGGLRYNLTTGSLMPFVKGGYGWSWYRAENAASNDELLPHPDGPWIDRPSLKRPSTLLPNTWHLGAGVEWVPVRSVAAFPKGVDLGIRGGVTAYRHSLGIEIDAVIPTAAGFDWGARGARSPTVTRWVSEIALIASF